MKIEVTQPTVADLFRDFYEVPKFQREYVWKEENVRALLDDVEEALFDEEGTPIDSEYFIGSLVVYPTEGRVFQLIDGQQRTTTLFIVLCALRDALRNADPGEDLSDLDSLIQVRRRNAAGNLIGHFRVTPLYEDASDMLQRIGAGRLQEGLDLRRLSRSAAHMLEAYETARDFLSKFGADKAKLLRFYLRLSERVRLVRIETPSVADALRIFETINDRGVGLNAMDLLKNLLFMKADRADYERLTSLWKQVIQTIEGPQVREKPLRFLRYFLLSKYSDARRASKPLTEDDLYTWLDEHKARPDVGIEADPMGFAKELATAAEHYARIVKQPPQALHHMARLSARARQHMIVMLASASLDEQEQAYLTQRLEALFVAYVLTRQATKALDLVFANAAPKLRELVVGKAPGLARQAEVQGFVDSWVTPEVQKLGSRIDESLGELALDRKTMTRFVLCRVAMRLDQLANKPMRGIDDYWPYEIEHVLPNSPSAEQVAAFGSEADCDALKNSLGNLTLLEKSLNAALGRGSFTDKSRAYATSDVTMTRALAQVQGIGGSSAHTMAALRLSAFVEWTAESVQVRQRELIGLAKELWSYPRQVPT